MEHFNESLEAFKTEFYGERVICDFPHALKTLETELRKLRSSLKRRNKKTLTTDQIAEFRARKRNVNLEMRAVKRMMWYADVITEANTYSRLFTSDKNNTSNVETQNHPGDD